MHRTATSLRQVFCKYFFGEWPGNLSNQHGIWFFNKFTADCSRPVHCKTFLRKLQPVSETTDRGGLVMFSNINSGLNGQKNNVGVHSWQFTWIGVAKCKRSHWSLNNKCWRIWRSATCTQKGKTYGSDPDYFKNCDNCPVEQVRWNDVQEFIK